MLSKNLFLPSDYILVLAKKCSSFANNKLIQRHVTHTLNRENVPGNIEMVLIPCGRIDIVFTQPYIFIIPLRVHASCCISRWIRNSLWCFGFPGGASGKESACLCRRWKRGGFNSWVKKTPRSRKWQPTSVCLTGKSHGQMNLALYSLGYRKESDMIEHTCFFVMPYSNSNNQNLFRYIGDLKTLKFSFVSFLPIIDTRLWINLK